MKAITIHQPWAMLCALQEKRNETRSWATKHRGPLAIHAGQKVDREACEREPVKSVLAKYGYTADNLPAGAVVAVCTLAECWNVQHHGGKVYKTGNGLPMPIPMNDFRGDAEILGNELVFGDYTPGRYAWELADVKQLPEPISVKGKQGLWNWENNTAGTIRPEPH